ncbi:DUF418 domain-containing protein [Porticoccaceae bacterium LTM1]|nr:DUF418 domain-containing protein [Porticoccaceae bacterium LTM1]
MQTERLVSLDTIRGIAVLGILFMNLFTIAVPYTAYSSPEWNNNATNFDYWVYAIQHLLFDGRFMTLFCLLFGAGLALFREKLESRDYPAKPVLYSRLRWLLLFGALHAVFIWFGDILFSYALAGLFIVASGLIHQPPKSLLKIGIGLFAAGYLLFALLWYLLPILPEDFLIEKMGSATNSPEFIAGDVSIWTGPYSEQLLNQASLFIESIMAMVFMGPIWAVIGMMLIGIVLYKLDIFRTGLKSHTQWLLLTGGLLLSGYDLWICWQNGFNSFRNTFSPWNFIAALMMALGYLSLIVKATNHCQGQENLFSRVGRMAFSFYIFQSISMILVFRWLAPELYGQLDRLSLIGIAVAMSVLQIFIAKYWLSHFQQGPLEALWRKLTWRGIQETVQPEQPST